MKNQFDNMNEIHEETSAQSCSGRDSGPDLERLQKFCQDDINLFNALAGFKERQTTLGLDLEQIIKGLKAENSSAVNLSKEYSISISFLEEAQMFAVFTVNFYSNCEIQSVVHLVHRISSLDASELPEVLEGLLEKLDDECIAIHTV